MTRSSLTTTFGIAFFMTAILASIPQKAFGQNPPCYETIIKDCSIEFDPVPGPEWDPPCNDDTNICELLPPAGIPGCHDNLVVYVPNGTFRQTSTEAVLGTGHEYEVAAQHCCVLRIECICNENMIDEVCGVGTSTCHYGTTVIDTWGDGPTCLTIGG